MAWGVFLGTLQMRWGALWVPVGLVKANQASLESFVYGCPGWAFGNSILLFVPCPGLKRLNFIINR